MKRITRRTLMAGAAGISGLGFAKLLSQRPGLLPPDYLGPYGLGETLTYDALRLAAGQGLAREFPREMISEKPFVNSVAPLPNIFHEMLLRDFADWRLVVNGMVERPLSLSLADLGMMPMRSQITEVSCEEGWSYIAEWTGVPLSHVLNQAGVKPGARYISYSTIQTKKWDTIDLDEAMHPQTLLTIGMNGGTLPVKFGGPLRMRVPRQLGYKSLKFITSVMAVSSFDAVRSGLGNGDPDYSWFAGI